MGQPLRKFIPRAPRYVLRPSDNQIFRFASNRQQSNSHMTKFLNISQTGVASLVSREFMPQIGEHIKVEFPVPGGEQVAWWARVVRMEVYEPGWWGPRDIFGDDIILIGATFHDLPDGHQYALKKGLEKKFIEVLRERRNEQTQAIRQFLIEHGWQVFIYLVATTFTVATLYFLSRPSENYDEQRGAPWGQRFKFFEWEEK